MRNIEDEQRIFTSPGRVFEALIRPSDICAWWRASSAIVFPEPGGLWVAAWGDADDPDYLTAATLSEFQPGKVLEMSDYRYRAKSGPMPFEMETVVRFTLDESDGGALLKVSQSGFPDDAIADDYFAGCVKGWRDTLENISKHLK